MLIALPRLLRIRPFSIIRPALQTCTYSVSIPALVATREPIEDYVSIPASRNGDDRNHVGQAPEPHCSAIDPLKYQGVNDDKTQPIPALATNKNSVTLRSRRKLKDPDRWIRLLEKYIPKSLRHTLQDDDPEPPHPDLVGDKVLQILNDARKPQNTGIDILAHMILNSRKKAALWVCDILLKNLTSRSSSESLELPPSNIIWPEMGINTMTDRSISIDTVSRVSTQSCTEWELPAIDPRYSSDAPLIQNQTMEQIWITLGSVIVQSADLEEEDALKAINTVHLVLGQIHNLGLVPDNVYTYQAASHSTVAQRSPIIHLVSSRILTALSDAAWREQQDESIEKAASHGLSYREIGRNPPGGRFRLKVRPLEAEVWLEFVLWCCAEGGFTNAGSYVITMIQAKIENPWFAVTWSNRKSTEQNTPQVDWERVKSRTGGTVGRIEGYSTVKPLAEVPPRTISTEVVLALVEAHIDAVISTDGSGKDRSEAIQRGIVSLISFLEPHDLPVWYFDYLSVRLSLNGMFEHLGDRISILKRWCERLIHLKSLKPVQHPAPPQVSFQLNALLVHSEFMAGLFHQLLDGYVQEGHVHEALKTFNELQKLVDNSKLHAIGAFLSRMYSPDKQSSSSGFFEANNDFVSSHGQLPMYKLAGLLNLAVDTNLVGLGQWLLYNQDPDGPLIPKAEYSTSAVAQALLRFAGLSNDGQLLEDVTNARRHSPLQPSVNYLRIAFNARILMLDFEGGGRIMKRLNRAQAGGFGLSNLAHLAGTILKLENNINISDEYRESRLTHAIHLLNSMLAGHFQGRSGVLQQSVRMTFRQQVGHLLEVFKAYPKSSIATTAKSYHDQFRASNLPNLPPLIFNIFLEAVVEARGAMHGMHLVDLFCTTASEDHAPDHTISGDFIEDENMDPEMEADNEADDSNDAYIEADIDTIIVPDRELTAIENAKPPSIDPGFSFIPFMTDSTPKEADDTAVDESSPVDEAKSRKIQDALHLPDSDVGSNELTPNEGDFQSPFFQATVNMSSQRNDDNGYESQDRDVDPVCIFNTKTIRLVVRGATKQRREQQSAKLSTTEQSEVLRWAEGRFMQLGYSQDMIRNEIREPTPKIDAPKAYTSKSVIHRSKGRAERRARRKASRVTKTFQGKHELGGDGEDALAESY